MTDGKLKECVKDCIRFQRRIGRLEKAIDDMLCALPDRDGITHWVGCDDGAHYPCTVRKIAREALGEK